MADSPTTRRRFTSAVDAIRDPSPRLRASLLVVAAVGTAVLILNGLVPFLPASVADETQTGLIADPAAGNGVEPDPGFVWVVASAYGSNLIGQETACGELLEESSRIVAHRDLECGTPLEIRVDGKAIEATIGDRGPFVDGRELDLAPAVWRGLGFASEAAFGVRGAQVQLLDG